MANLSIRLEEKDKKLISDYSKFKNISISDLVRNAVLESIEDELDLDAYNKAFDEYNKDKKRYTHNEIKQELGLL